MKVPVPKQRLIFHGKLLADSDKLSKYKVNFYYRFKLQILYKKD